jgi:hypothetical protein
MKDESHIPLNSKGKTQKATCKPTPEPQKKEKKGNERE